MQKKLIALGLLTLIVLPSHGGAFPAAAPGPAPRPEPYFAPMDPNASRLIAMFGQKVPTGAWIRFVIERSDVISGQPLPVPQWAPQWMPQWNPEPAYPQPMLPEPEFLEPSCFQPVGVRAYELEAPRYLNEPTFAEASVKELLSGKITKGIRKVQDINIGGTVYTRYSFSCSPEPGLTLGYEVTIDKSSALPELEQFLESFSYLDPPVGRSQEEGFPPVLVPQGPSFPA